MKKEGKKELGNIKRLMNKNKVCMGEVNRLTCAVFQFL